MMHLLLLSVLVFSVTSFSEEPRVHVLEKASDARNKKEEAIARFAQELPVSVSYEKGSEDSVASIEKLSLLQQESAKEDSEVRLKDNNLIAALALEGVKLALYDDKDEGTFPTYRQMITLKGAKPRQIPVWRSHVAFYYRDKKLRTIYCALAQDEKGPITNLDSPGELISGEEALAKTRKALAYDKAPTVGEAELGVYSSVLVANGTQDKARLHVAYLVKFSLGKDHDPLRVYVDAVSGKIIHLQ